MACGVTLDTAGGKANHEFRGAGSGRHFSFIYVGRIFVSFLFSKLAMRYSREAQGAGDTSASFTLDIFLPAFGFQMLSKPAMKEAQGAGETSASFTFSYVVSCFASFLLTNGNLQAGRTLEN